jgi:hypothetical protein
MINNSAANAGRTNFTNKQLTVRRKIKNDIVLFCF